MTKKVIQLTEDEFKAMINEAVSQTFIEMDGKTAMCVPKISTKAQDEIQNGIDNRQINVPKTVTDELNQKAQNMRSRVENHWVQQFKGLTFKFFSKDKIGIVTNILFTFEKLTKLSADKTILTGVVSYNNQSIIGDGIIINFNKDTVKYHEQGSRYQYSLEIDMRTKPQWDGLLEQLQIALNIQDESI